MGKTEVILETPDRIRDAKAVIILTSYGRDTLLSRAIESTVFQSYKDYLVFIVDDNSSEVNSRTQNIIKSFADRYDNVVFFRTLTSPRERKKVSTFCRNINFMLKIARSANIKYVSYLPCDDYYAPNRLSVPITFLEKTGHGSCWTYVKRIDKHGHGQGLIPSTGLQYMCRAVSILDHSCVTHRVDLIDHLAYPYWPLDKSSEHQAPDGLFYNKLIQVSGSIQPVSREVLGYKMIHPHSIQGRAYGWK